MVSGMGNQPSLPVLTSSIIGAVDKGEKVIGICLDLSRAFEFCLMIN